jgi:MFS transporter, PPP family, 3-phenylpropionic acid transporter
LLFALGGVTTAALLPFFALWLRQRGLDPERIGLVLAASSLAAVAATPVWSNASDSRLGPVRTLRLSSAASACAAMALALTGTALWPILGLAALLGIATGPGTALEDSIAIGYLGPARMTHYGSIRLWASVGWAIACVVFGAWFERAGLGLVFAAFAIGSLAIAVLTLRLPAPRPTDDAVAGTRLGSFGDAFRSVPRLVPFLAGLFVVSVATAGAWSFVPIRIDAGGGGPFLVGLSAGVAAVFEVPFMLWSGWLAEHVGLRTLYAGGCAIYAAMMVAWAFAASPTLVALILMVRGTGFGLTYVALVVMTGRLMPGRLRTTGQGLLQIVAMGLAPVVGTALGGIVYQRLGPPTLFALAAALVAVGAAIVWATMSGAPFTRTRAA